MQEAMDKTPDNNLDQWAEQGSPPRLKAGLENLFGSTPAVSRAMDEQILSAARQQTIPHNRMRWMIRYAIGPIAAAAAVILIAVKVNHRDQASVNARSAAVAQAEDVNHDGKLDMLDAF